MCVGGIGIALQAPARSHVEDVLAKPAHTVLDRTVDEQQPSLDGAQMLIGEQRIQHIVLGQQPEEFGQRAAGEHLQALPRRFSHATMMVNQLRIHKQPQNYSHATLVQRCQDVQVIDVRMAEALAVVHQHDAIVTRLVVMPVAVLDQKVEDGHVDQVEQTWLGHLHLLVAVKDCQDIVSNLF